MWVEVKPSISMFFAGIDFYNLSHESGAILITPGETGGFNQLTYPKP
jgi:hypothetical protein